MEAETKRQEIERLRARITELEAEIAADESSTGWRPSGYYTAYYATAGFMLGSFGAIVEPALQRHLRPDRRQDSTRIDPRLPDFSAGREGPAIDRLGAQTVTPWATA